MKALAFLSGLSILVAPIAYISFEAENFVSSQMTFGSFYRSSSGEVFWFKNSNDETIKGEWFESEGVYHDMFGDLVILFYVTVILAIVAMVLAMKAGKRESGKPAALLGMICGFLLIFLRFMRLDENDLTFYEKDTFFGQEITYLEIPIAGMLSIVLGLISFTKE